jgi:hypothetical protein
VATVIESFLEISHVVLWLADVYVMSSLLLVLTIAAFAILRQPARLGPSVMAGCW